MAELPWVDFTRLHSVAHLVAATVLPTRTAPHLSRLRRLLNQLIREQAPGGDFATAIVRVTDIAEIHCGFSAEADADRLASLVEARAAHPPETEASGWSSYRTFRLGAAKEVAPAGLLATQRQKRRPS
jgi:hypothetical protein